MTYERYRHARDEAMRGRTVELEAINRDVAAHWGVSPESCKEILGAWYRAYDLR